MVHAPKMIKVAFIPPGNKEWMGGVNYFKNLFFALSTLEHKAIEPIVFVGRNADKDIKQIYSQYSQVIEHPFFDKNGLYRVVDRILKYYFSEALLRKYHIDVLSHSRVVRSTGLKAISWIPDFQHIHLPEMFSRIEVVNRNYHFKKLAKYSDRVILSSYSALNDFKAFAPDYEYKADVLQFVSQPEAITQLNSSISIKDRYGISGRFFYLPNQFWKHKNHMVAFEAINHLKNKGINMRLVCSGLMVDHRNSEYVSTLLEYIENNNLEKNILHLGSIPYPDVFHLINESTAVINPSLFEGWSSTVEECKSVGKEMILSDIKVHKEQYPESVFFVNNDALSLAAKMESLGNNVMKEANGVYLDLQVRTKCFAEKYQDIILNLHDRA